MSEAELITAFQEYLAQNDALIFGYISFMSGFLIMSYIVADKLPKPLAVVVIGLFTIVSGVLILKIYIVRNEITAIAGHIFEQTAAGNLDLPWWGSNPTWAPLTLSIFQIAATIGGFLACVAFFMYQRAQSDSGSA